MESKKAFPEESLIGKVVIFSTGEVVKVTDIEGNEVHGTPFLIDGGRVMACEQEPGDSIIVYAEEEAMEIFKDHINQAKKVGLWTDSDKPIELTIPSYTLERLEEEAERRKTTVNGLINTILSESVDEPVEAATNRF